MKKLFALFLCLALLLQLAPAVRAADPEPGTLPEDGEGAVLSGEGDDLPGGGSFILIGEGGSEGEGVPSGIRECSFYLFEEDGNICAELNLYDSENEYVEEPFGEFQYLWFYDPTGRGIWYDLPNAVPLGLSPEAWEDYLDAYIFDYSDNCSENAIPFFRQPEVMALTDGLWQDEPFRLSLTTDDVDTSRYVSGDMGGELHGEEASLFSEEEESFHAWIGVMVRWRAGSEEDWSFYASSGVSYCFDLTPGASYVPVFRAGPSSFDGEFADCNTPLDRTAYIAVEVSYPFGECSFQWFRSPTDSYDGEALEGETNYDLDAPFPTESGTDYYYCEVIYRYRDLEPGFWRSPVMPVTRTAAQGFAVELRPFSIYQGAITKTYPGHGSGYQSNSPFSAVNRCEYDSYGFTDAYFHTAVGDVPTVSAYILPADSLKTFTNCDEFTYEWYWSDREDERGTLIGSGSVLGLTEFTNDVISVGKADFSLMNQAANICVNPPTPEAGLFYLTFVGTVRYGGESYTYARTETMKVFEAEEDLYEYSEYNNLLLNYTGCSDEIVVPASYHGMPVKRFNLGAGLTDYTPAGVGVRKITLPEGLEAINRQCFYKLASLEECSIPSTVTEIGEKAFYGTELRQVRFSDDVFPTMGNYAFSHMQKLTTVVFPGNASGTLSGTETFSYAPSLRQVQNYASILDPRPADDFRQTPVLDRLDRSAEDDGVLYYILNDDGLGYTVIGFAAEAEEVTVPSTFRELPVVCIESSAFESCSGLKRLTVGAGVREIQSYAFYDCKALESVTLGEGVETVGDYAFYGCSSLRTLTLSEGLESIGRSAFFGCSALAGFAVPSTLESIGDYAFKNLFSLTSVDFSRAESLRVIGSEAFAYDYYLGSPVTLPTGTLVKDHAFYFCVSIPSVTVEGCRLENASFHWCTSLDEIVGSWTPAYEDVAVGKLCCYDNFLFARCLHVTTDRTYYRRTDAGYEAVDNLYYNSQITYYRSGDVAYTLGESDKYQGKWYGQYYLDILASDLYIPGTLEVEGETVPVTGLSHSMFEEMRSPAWDIVVGEGIEDIECYGYRRIRSFQFPSTVKRFTGTLFHYSPGLRDFGSPFLTEIYLPASLEEIPQEAFANCENLKTVTFDPEWGSTPLSRGMFLDCPAIQEIVLPASLRTVPEECFFMCSSLRRVDFPSGLQSIGVRAFASCWSLTEIDLPASLERFDTVLHSGGNAYPVDYSDAFAGCDLKAVDLTLCPLLTELPGGVFCANGELTSIRLGDGIRSIGDYAFARSGMQSVYLSGDRPVRYGKHRVTEYRPVTELRWPANLTSIGNGAFYDSFLGEEGDEVFLLTLPESVKTIGDWAFSAGNHSAYYSQQHYNCVDLPEGALPAGLLSLGEGTFQYTTLSGVTVPQGVTVIPDYCFAGTPLLTEVNLPDSVTDIGDWAFSSCAMAVPDGKYTLPADLKSIGFAAFVATPAIRHWVLPAGVETVERRGFDFLADGEAKSLTFFNQDGALPVIRLDDELFSVPVTIRCYENSAARLWAKSMQAANGDNVRIGSLDDSTILRVLLRKRDGGTVGARELRSVAWYDETAGDGLVLSRETSLEEGIDASHVYRVELVTSDELRYDYLAPETLSLSVFPETETSVEYVLDPRERVTYSFSIQDFDIHAGIHNLTVFTSVGEIEYSYTKFDGTLAYDYDSRRFSLNLPRVETSLFVTMEDHLPLRLKHLQMREAVEGVIDLGELELERGHLSPEYPLRFLEAVTGKTLNPGFDGSFSLRNLTTGEDVPGVSVYRTLRLPDNAEGLVTAGDELELRYLPTSPYGFTLAEPYRFAAAKSGMAPVLEPRVNRPASVSVTAATRSVRLALFAADGTLLKCDAGSLRLETLSAGEYALLAWNCEGLRSIPSPDFLEKCELPAEAYFREALTLGSGEELSKALEDELPELDLADFIGDVSVSLTADEARLSNSMLPVYLSFTSQGPAQGKEKTFTVREADGVAGRFIEYGGCFAYVNGKPAEAEFSSGGGHTRPTLTVRTREDEGVVTFYARPEGQLLEISEVTMNGLPLVLPLPSVKLPAKSFEFAAPAAFSSQNSGSLQLSYLSSEPTRALIFVDGRLTDTAEIPGKAFPSSVALPYSFETGGSAETHTVGAVIVNSGFSGDEEDWFDLVLAEDGSYEAAVLASSPEYSITWLPEAIPEPLRLVISGTNGETSGWDGVRPVETAVVDFVNKTAERLKFVVTYWNLNDDGTIKSDYILDYALTMAHPELVTPDSVYLDVYCNESAAEPTVYRIPLSQNPRTGSFEGSLTFPGGTVTANDMPYYVYVGYGYETAPETTELSDEYLAELAEQAAAELRAIYDDARAEAEYFDLDLDLDMVELLLETELDFLNEEEKQTIRDAALGMKELAEIHAGARQGVAESEAAMQLLCGGGFTYGTCEGLDEETLLGMGARRLETESGVLYALINEEGAETYDLENNVSVRMDAAGLTEALLASGNAPALSGDAALFSDAERDAARLMEDAGPFVEAAATVAGYRNTILSFLDLAESVLDLKNAAAEAEVLALERDAAEAQKNLAAVRKKTMEALHGASPSDPMYKELMRKLQKYQALRNEAVYAVNEAHRAEKLRLFGRIKTVMTGMRMGLLSGGTNFAFAANAEKTLSELAKAAQGSVGKIAEGVAKAFKFGGAILGIAGIAMDIASLISAYGGLLNQLKRCENVHETIGKSMDRLGYAYAEIHGFSLRKEILELHGLSPEGQLDKGRSVWLQMMGDNFDVYSCYETAFYMKDLGGTGAGILSSLSALTGNIYVVAGFTGVSALYSATVGLTNAIMLQNAENALDEDWEDYYEHVVRPVGGKGEEEEEEEENDRGSETGGAGMRTPTAPQIDPAGYVYEAVASNRVSGVTVSAYYRDNGAEVYWDDADFYDEVNPQITDETGTYSWYTPIGNWKVRAEKDGYEPASSEADPAAEEGWLPVPPPQMNVYIPMVSRVAPAVESILAAPTEVRITFTKYMDAAQLSEAPALLRLTLDGAETGFRFAFADLEESPLSPGIFYGRTLVLTPEDGGRFGGETAEVTVGGAFRSYAGTPLGSDFHSGETPILPLAAEITVLRAGELRTDVGTERSILVEVRDTEGRLMEDAVVEAVSAYGRLEVTASGIPTDEEGRAVLRVSGLSGGTDAILLSSGIAEAELAARVSVDTDTSSLQGAVLSSEILSSDGTGVELLASVRNTTDYPGGGTLIAAAYRDGQFLGAAMGVVSELLPGENAELPLEIACSAAGELSLKLFYVDAETFAPLTENR